MYILWDFLVQQTDKEAQNVEVFKLLTFLVVISIYNQLSKLK